MLVYSLRRFINGRAPLNIGENIELQNHCGVNEGSSKALSFVIDTIHDFPDVFERLQSKEKAFFNEKFITQASQDILESFVEHKHEHTPQDWIDEMKTTLEKLKNLLKARS